ncbi:E3 ubiquitin protein ligase RIN2 [Zea mays]|uniref:E3 ubiquitin protein ligase RIN2 n=1 Tax=Zea mays TaxID=4577 RepID=A0A1D6EVP0_MAIZE|nr:E3 ubiquitin protein ligase RIN2 [Zea mays]
MAAVNCLYVAAASTAASAAALQWWASSLFDGDAGAGEDGAWLGAVLRSKVTVALLANLAVHVFLVIILALKTLFFVQLTSIETRKVLEHIINYVIYKLCCHPLSFIHYVLAVCNLTNDEDTIYNTINRSSIAGNFSPTGCASYFSANYPLVNLVGHSLFAEGCGSVQGFAASVIPSCFGSCSLSHLVLPLIHCSTSESLHDLSHIDFCWQSIMVHGFQLFDIWQQHLMESGADFLDLQKSYKQAAGSFSEWRGKLTRNFGFAIDLISLLMSLGHYSMIFWLRGMAFHLVDAVLLLNSRALIVSFLKRIKAHIKLRKALSSLDGALPDATYDEICAYDDECAICRGPMGRAKKLSCNHLFHLACLRSWYALTFHI